MLFRFPLPKRSTCLLPPNQKKWGVEPPFFESSPLIQKPICLHINLFTFLIPSITAFFALLQNLRFSLTEELSLFPRVVVERDVKSLPFQLRSAPFPPRAPCPSGFLLDRLV